MVFFSKIHGIGLGKTYLNKKKSLAATYFPANAVSSALEGLTSVFGMGTGVTPLPWLPSKNDYIIGDTFCKGVKGFFLKKKVYFFSTPLP